MSRNKKLRTQNRPPVVVQGESVQDTVNLDAANKRENSSSRTITRTVSAEFSAFKGPLPSPEVLARYAEIIPNGADRIVAMAESQLKHRQTLESAVVHGNVQAQSRGQFMAFILALVAIGGGIGLIAYDKDTAGLTAIIGSLATLAAVFIYSRIEQARERREKRAELQRASENPKLPFDSN